MRIAGKESVRKRERDGERERREGERTMCCYGDIRFRGATVQRRIVSATSTLDIQIVTVIKSTAYA